MKQRKIIAILDRSNNTVKKSTRLRGASGKIENEMNQKENDLFKRCYSLQAQHNFFVWQFINFKMKMTDLHQK